MNGLLQFSFVDLLLQEFGVCGLVRTTPDNHQLQTIVRRPQSGDRLNHMVVSLADDDQALMAMQDGYGMICVEDRALLRRRSFLDMPAAILWYRST